MTMPPALTQLTEMEQAFKDAVSDFAKKRLAPLVHDMDKNQKLDAGLVKDLFELGVMGVEIPESFGGGGGSFLMACLAVEALSAVDPSVGVCVDVQNTLVINLFSNWGNDDQKARYFPRLATDTVGAYALSEATSGSDAFALKCRATAEGEDFILKGNKLWITNAGEAGVFLVFATVDPAAGYKGITCFIVDRDMPGFSVGKKEDKLGIRASSTCELILDSVRVPKTNVLGQVGQGYKLAIETLNEGRIAIGAQMVGLAQGALDHAVRYTQERQQFGQALASFQGVQFQLAQMATMVEASRLMVYNAARLRENKIPFLKEAAMAKVFASQSAQQVASMAVDLFGGNGFTTEYPVEKLYRDSKIGTIYEGTTNMQYATIAKMLVR